MYSDQSHFRPAHRVRHSPRLLNGDTAGAPDPYAASPYGGGSFDIEPASELGPSADQMHSYLAAPSGMRGFDAHDYPTFDSSFAYQNQSLWDDLATNCFWPDWITAEERQEVQSFEIHPKYLPSALDTFQVDQQPILDVNSIVTPRIPYVHNEPILPWYEDPFPNHIVEENAPYGTNETNWDVTLNSLLNVEQTGHHLPQNSNQLSPQKDSGNSFQNSSDWPPLEFRESSLNPSSRSNPRLINQPRLKTGAASRSNSTRRRSRPKCHPYELLIDLDLPIRRASRPALRAISQRRPPSQNACVACRIAKRTCHVVDQEGRCGRCEPEQRCFSAGNILPMLNLPEIYTETELPLSSLSDPVLNPPRIYRASIYVSFGSAKFGVPLACKISEPKSTSDHSPRSSMVWENLWSSNTDKNCVQKDLLASCFIPGTCMPSADTLLRWAVDSVQQLPSGAVEDLFGPLYTFATNYIRVGSRSLYDLMALTLIHTAIYNVCHSKMTIVFDKRPHARISLPLRLRTQICTSLFQLFKVTGDEIRKRVIGALHGPPKETRLGFCVVNLLLLLTYEHCCEQTSKKAFPITSTESDYGDSELAERKKYFEAIVQDLRNLQRALFKTGLDFSNPVFDASWQGSKRDDGKDDLELKAALSTLRTAMHEHQASKVLADTILVPSLAPQLYPEVVFQKTGHTPMSVADTVSTSKKLDFDNMSADTGLGNEDGSKPLSRPQAIQNVLQTLKVQNLRNGRQETDASHVGC